jgi:hypothetical protein
VLPHPAGLVDGEVGQLRNELRFMGREQLGVTLGDIRHDDIELTARQPI